MNPDKGEDADDWFARFEREARESSASAPQPAAPLSEPPATEALDARELEATQAMPATPESPEPTQAMPTAEAAPTEALERAPLRPPGDDGSALDSLFRDDRFREYEAGPDPNEAPFANRPRSKELVQVEGGAATPPTRHFGAPQKILVGVGVGLLAALALIALFLLGVRLPDLLGPAPAVATPTPTPTPTLTALPIGPVEPGEYSWDELLGGECLDPYENAWQEEYTVVACDEPHGGQLVYRVWFPPEVVDAENPQVGKPTDPYPGAEALAAQITLLCSAPGVVDLAVAGGIGDAQIQGAYPATDEQWDADPSYYCFFSRSSGEPLTVSVAVPRAMPTP